MERKTLSFYFRTEKKESAVMHLITACSGSQTVKDQVTDTTAKQMIIPYFS